MENEELPFISLNLAGQEFKATPLNASFYGFAGRTVLENGDSFDNSTRNHVFLLTGEEEGQYVFSPRVVASMGAIMIRYGFPCAINVRTIPERDENAYQQYLTQIEPVDEVPDTLPEGW